MKKQVVYTEAEEGMESNKEFRARMRREAAMRKTERDDAKLEKFIVGIRLKVKEFGDQGRINIDCMGNYVAPENREAFMLPFLWRSEQEVYRSNSEVKEFMTEIDSIKVVVKSRRPLNFRVYYSGYLENDRGMKLEFEGVDNNFCINVG